MYADHMCTKVFYTCKSEEFLSCFRSALTVVQHISTSWHVDNELFFLSLLMTERRISSVLWTQRPLPKSVFSHSSRRLWCRERRDLYSTVQRDRDLRGETGQRASCLFDGDANHLAGMTWRELIFYQCRGDYSTKVFQLLISDYFLKRYLKYFNTILIHRK